jgi:hypothetical protein
MSTPPNFGPGEVDPTPRRPEPLPIIVDLGKQSRRQIRALREGQGRLLEQIRTVVNDLKQEGSVEGSAQVVVVVVTKKRKPSQNDWLSGCPW